RNRREIERLIGCFINTLVMRVEIGGEEKFRGLLEQVRERALGAYGHQDMPFERLVEGMEPERSLSHPPLVQVTLTLQNAPLGAIEMGGVRVRPIVVDSGTVEYDMSVIMGEGGGVIGGMVVYNAELFEGETIRRMVRQLERVMEEVVGDVEVRIGSIR